MTAAPEPAPPPPAHLAGLAGVPFADPGAAARRLGAVLEAAGPPPDAVLARALPPLLTALADAPAPDAGLVNFERFARASVARADKPPHALFHYLAGNPRAAEILVRLSVGSQYLADILVRNPDYLRRLTEHRRLPQYKSRADFLLEALAMADGLADPAARLDALRRYQHWELLRIGACDAFGLLDLKSVTAQLSLLADGFTQACLNILSAELDVDAGAFCVLAFGKLGGEELNYSSDIDLAFLARGDATKYWGLGQRLIKALSQATGEGFLYRVDMRLRPWGRSGPLVNTPDAHLAYLAKHAKQWERQALIQGPPDRRRPGPRPGVSGTGRTPYLRHAAGRGPRQRAGLQGPHRGLAQEGRPGVGRGEERGRQHPRHRVHRPMFAADLRRRGAGRAGVRHARRAGPAGGPRAALGGRVPQAHRRL